MKLIVSSDWHLDVITLGVARRQEIEAAVWETVKAAEQRKVQHYVFMGDLCDWDMSGWTEAIRVATQVAEKLQSLGIKSHWMAGNHDVVEDGSGTSSLTPLRGLGYCNVYEASCPDNLTVPTLDGGQHAHFFPYPPTSHDYAFPKKYAKGDYVFGHLMVPGIIPGEETVEMPRGREVRLPVADLQQCRVFNGHYHRRSVQGLVKIPGTLARLTFGEGENEPGFFYVDGDDLEVIKVKKPSQLKTVDVDDEQEEFAAKPGNFYRLRPAEKFEGDAEVVAARIRVKGVPVKVLPAPRSNPLPEKKKSAKLSASMSARSVVEQMVGEVAEDIRVQVAAMAQETMAKVKL